MAESDSSSVKKEWTEEERLALAEKLDADLDEFIDGLEKKRYTEGWPEDRWEEEMDKHPFFMKKAPQPGDDVHPMFEGLQKLKYDPAENTREELALNYKEDGNFYMKHKKFRMAIYSYTEGIKAQCDKPDVLSVLYNNRSAAHFFLNNYRSSLSDAQHALNLKPDYAKALWRAAQCSYHTEKFDLCSDLCLRILNSNTDDAEAKALLAKNRKRQQEIERDARKELASKRKRLAAFERLRSKLVERKIKFDDLPKDSVITEELLHPKFQPVEDHPVHLSTSEAGAESAEATTVLIWPAAFSYPEFLISDFHQNLSEDITMKECIFSMCVDRADELSAYSADKLTVYYENRKAGTVHKVDQSKTIADIIDEKSFFVSGGTLLFYVVPTDTPVEQKYLNQSRHPLIFLK